MNHKNDYSVLVYFIDNPVPKKWSFVHKLNGFSMFLNEKHPDWAYFNVYDRRSRQFLKQFKKGHFVPAFLD